MPNTKSAKSKREKKSAKKAPQEKVKHYANRLFYLFVLVVLLVIVAISIYAFAPSVSPTVPFSTFKSNLASAKNISILVTYNNISMLNSESACFTALVEVLSRQRNPLSIDFFLTNSTSCTYVPGGLGHTINPATATSQACIKAAGSEPGVFLNYSLTNRTVITKSRFTVYGNAAYFNKCAIAPDFS